MTTATKKELRWERIQATREKDRSTGEPVPGSLGKAFLRWANNMVERVLILTRDRDFNVTYQRFVGGQIGTAPIEHFMTEGEVFSILKSQFPKHVPAGKTGFNPALLPSDIVKAVWEQ